MTSEEDLFNTVCSQDMNLNFDHGIVFNFENLHIEFTFGGYFNIKDLTYVSEIFY